MRRARRASSSVGARVQRLFPKKEGSSLLASSGTRVTRHSTPSYPASFSSLTASSGVRSGRPTVKTPSFIDLLSILSGHQGRPLPGDLVLEGHSRNVSAQLINDKAAHAPALATLR